METIERRDTWSLWWHVRHPLATRWTRVPILVVGVLGAVSVMALALRSNWVECRSVEEWYSQTCPIIPRRLLLIRTTSFLGIGAMILGPLINSLYRLFRYGQQWEGSHAETATSNIPILAGVAYLVLALVIAWV